MTTSKDAALALVRRGYEAGWNQGRLDLLDEILAPDFRAHDPASPGGVVGRAEGRDLLVQMREAFPDVRREALDHVGDGDKIAVRWRVTGTHRGPFMGLAPTGRRIEVTGITLYRLEGGRIAEEWVQMDALGFQRQLGIR
jgi:steroid delta-isomerase-like uncharacterized protein